MKTLLAVQLIHLALKMIQNMELLIHSLGHLIK
jgi:hypothetical protein